MKAIRMIGVLAAIFAAGASARVAEQTATALDPANGRLRYTEQHLTRHQNDRLLERLVVYRCADGTAFARKLIDYRESTQAPAFELTDARDGYREGFRRGLVPALWVRRPGSPREQSAAAAEADLVVDAGFDEFVRQQWSRLLSGAAVPVRFAVPSRRQSLAFEISRLGAAQVAGQAAERFRLRLDGWLGWLVPQIVVTYSRADRRLLRFEGLSNLRGDGDRAPVQARIDFPAPPRQVAEGRWQQVAGEPLGNCQIGR